MKALIRSCSATPESKKLLDDMRTNNKKKWYALVRQCRIRASADEVGVSHIHSRKKAVLEATQSMVQAFGVRDSSEVLWLTRDRFIAHQVYVEGIAGATLEQNNNRRTPSGIVTLLMQTLSGWLLVWTRNSESWVCHAHRDTADANLTAL